MYFANSFFFFFKYAFICVYKYTYLWHGVSCLNTLSGAGGTPKSPLGRLLSFPVYREIPQQCRRTCCSFDGQLGNYEATTPECYTTLPPAHGHFFSAPALLAVSAAPPRSLCVSPSDTFKMAQLPLQPCALSLISNHSA